MLYSPKLVHDKTGLIPNTVTFLRCGFSAAWTRMFYERSSVLSLILRGSVVEQIIVFEDGVAGVNCEQVCPVFRCSLTRKAVELFRCAELAAEVRLRGLIVSSQLYQLFPQFSASIRLRSRCHPEPYRLHTFTGERTLEACGQP
jgi:hypothetical protein